MNTHSIKEKHLDDVRQALLELGEATKPQLAAHTDLSVVTINSLIRTLSDANEIIQQENTVTNGGRPAAVYSLNTNFKLALIFGTREKQGVDYITASVINLRGELVEPHQQFTELNISNLDASISYYIRKYPAIQVIAFALPAKEHNGEIIFSDYPQLDHFPLRSYLSEKYHIPCIIENDTRVAVLGYYARHQSASMQIIAGIYFPRKYSAGIGIMINGTMLSGTNGLASEIEFLPAYRDIQWINRSLQQTIDLIQTICVMYNPDTILLYDEFLTPEMFAQIRESFEHDDYHYFQPELVLLPQIEEDYMTGLKQFALSHL